MRALNPSVASRGFGDDAMNCNESPGNGTHNAGVSLSALVQGCRLPEPDRIGMDMGDACMAAAFVGQR